MIAPVDVRPARSADEIDAAYELAARVFGPSYFESADIKRRVRELEPLRSMHDVIVAVDGHEIVGLVRILDRELEGAEGPVPVGGVTSVCVHPRFRGTGTGVAIMESALERSRDRSDVCSVLFARRAVDGWYPRLGYVGVGAHPQLRLIRHPAAAARAAMPMDPARAAIYARAYQDSYGRLSLSFARGEAWWRSLALQLALKPVLRTTEVAGPNGIAGYLILEGEAVIEAAALDDGHGAVREAAFDHGILRLPVRHWLMHDARSQDHELGVRYSWGGGHMMRILDRDRFAAALGLSAGALPDADTRTHDGSRELLLVVAGAAGRAALWPDPPAWSLVDEF